MCRTPSDMTSPNAKIAVSQFAFFTLHFSLYTSLLLASAALRADDDPWSKWRTQIQPARLITVTAEPITLSPDKPLMWVKGTILQKLRTPGIVPANGAVDPASITVHHGDQILVKDKDYIADPIWGSLGIGPQPGVTTSDRLAVDYRYSLR